MNNLSTNNLTAKNRNRIIYSFLFFLCLSSQAFSQGLPLTLLDAQNMEPLIAAEVYSDDGNFGATTNENGVVYIKGVALDEHLNFKYLGYHTERMTLKEIIRSSDTILLEVISIQFTDLKIFGNAVGVERRENIANQVQVVDAKKIALLNPQNSADLLTASGAFVQKSQMGGGSPIIRGFEANKLLIVIDGVRLNNAIYRNGHLQNVITIDNAVLDRVEIVQGPASVIYGSDALGGVMHFITKEPRLALRKGQDEIFDGSAYVRYSTANDEKAFHLDFNYGTKKLALLSSISFVDFNDLRVGTTGMDDYPGFGQSYFYVSQAPDTSTIEPDDFIDVVNTNPDPLVQLNTGYFQFDLLQKVKYQYNEELSFLVNFQYSTTNDVPRFDQLNNDFSIVDQDTIPKFAVWNYGPQNRLFFSAKARYTPKHNKYFNEASTILSVQKVDEDRITRRFGKSNEVHQEEDVYVAALNADFTKIFNRQKNQLLLYGTEVVYNFVNSDAYSVLLNGIDPREATRYPSGGSSMFTAAFYANYRQTFFDKLDVMAGTRGTFISLVSNFDPINDIVKLPFEQIKTNDGAVTFSTSLSYEVFNDFFIDAVASSAFRAPNVDDFGKVRAKNGYVTVPNEGLGSEKSYNGEVSLTKRVKDNLGDRFLISGTYYYTYLVDIIVRDYFTLPDQVTGRDTNLLYIEGSYDTIQANVNGGQGFIQGVSASLQWNPIRNLQLTSSFNFVQGRQIADNGDLSPLAHIPPMYGQTALTYENDKIETTFLTRYNGWKRVEDYVVGSSDNLEYATVDGTPSWITYNIYFKYKINPRSTINLACENLMDRHYRPFSSGVSAPGRNFIITLRTKF